MTYMFCRNTVDQYEKWKSMFDSHVEDHRAAELKLVNLWRSVDDPNNVFFLFEVGNIEKARAFVNSPEGAEAGKASSVIDGEVHFLENADHY